MISQGSDELRKIFNLDPDTGRLFWNDPGRCHREKVGAEAGHIKDGRWVVKVGGKVLSRASIVFCMAHGRWAKPYVININGDRLDDRPCNLSQSVRKNGHLCPVRASQKYQKHIGEKFGELTMVKTLSKRADSGRILAEFDCSCGNKAVIPAGRVVGGSHKSCGCMTDRGAHRTHGMRNTREYSTWQSMKARCLCPDNKDYPRWGGRGVGLCQEWAESFEAFYEHIGPRPNGTSIDRIDNNKGYFPGNVRWATKKQQARNTRVFTVIDTPLGRMPLVDYAKLIGISRGAAHLRMKRGKLEGCSYADSTKC